MKLTSQLFVAGILLTAFSSCTMEKRTYMSGYHIEWNHNTENSNKNKEVASLCGKNIQHSVANEITVTTAVANEPCETLMASAENDFSAIATTITQQKRERSVSLKKEVNANSFTDKTTASEQKMKTKSGKKDFEFGLGLGIIFGVVSFFLTLLITYLAIAAVKSILTQ